MPAFHIVPAESAGPGPSVLKAILRTGRSLLAAVAVLLVSSAALGQTDPANQAVVEIVRLQHRSPDAIREAIAPLLDSRGAISQMDNNLIISTSRANLNELQGLITELDIPRRQMRISVDFSYIPGDNNQADEPASSGNPSDADGSVTNTVTTSAPEDNSRQSIVVSEGEYAYFSALNSTPILSVSATANGLLLTENQQQTGQSIGLSAELRDNEAWVRIATAQTQAEATAAGLQSRIVNTSVVLGFNDWFIINEEPAEETDSASVIATTVRPAEAIAIKVEMMP